MDEQDDVVAEESAQAPRQADDWSVNASKDPDGPRCPWCSAPLVDPGARECGSCGAQLAGAPDQPIPGVTAVDPQAVRGSTPSAEARKRRSVLSWITGEVDLVDVPPAPSSGGSLDATAAGDPALGTASGPVALGVLGPASPDAVAPPDARLRREMLLVQLEALGIAPETDAAPEAPGIAPETDAAPEALGIAPEADGGAVPAAGDEPAAPAAAGDEPAAPAAAAPVAAGDELAAPAAAGDLPAGGGPATDVPPDDGSARAGAPRPA
jgi:hypothetical protein